MEVFWTAVVDFLFTLADIVCTSVFGGWTTVYGATDFRTRARLIAPCILVILNFFLFLLGVWMQSIRARSLHQYPPYTKRERFVIWFLWSVLNVVALALAGETLVSVCVNDLDPVGPRILCSILKEKEIPHHTDYENAGNLVACILPGVGIVWVAFCQVLEHMLSIRDCPRPGTPAASNLLQDLSPARPSDATRGSIRSSLYPHTGLGQQQDDEEWAR